MIAKRVGVRYVEQIGGAGLCGCWVGSAAVDEVRHHRLTTHSQNGFGVELHPFHVEGPMAHPHDDPVGGRCRDLQFVGEVFGAHDEAVVAGGLDW